ncbi:MAG: hypothetical protein CVT49_13085 [candidate division Zixibacteria bacterium HGW-Zixibacteria-1]|nr:MAG: hypothetical protein CVT49_13085 [candidate division Zixibacteria bacterium HGW-Zixibacteria-1]
MYRYRISFYFSLFIFISMTTAVFADQPQFRVDSFIPQRFTDLELKVNGGMNSSGSRLSENQPFVSAYRRYENRRNEQNLELGGEIEKRYEVIPRFYLFRSDLLADFGREHFEDVDDFKYAITNLRKLESEITSYEYHIFNSYFIDAGIYILDDLFLSSEEEFSIDYVNTAWPSNDEDSYSRAIVANTLSENYQSQNEDINRDSKRYTIDVKLGPGWGRLYEGVYASTALYMIDELQKNSYLIKMPDYDQMMRLTEIIYQYNMKHIIDSRIRRIEALTAICDYLKSENIATELDPSGLVILQDVWDYFPRVSRKFGYRLRVGPVLSYYYLSSQTTTKGTIYELSTETDLNFPATVDTNLISETITHSYVHSKDIIKSGGLNIEGEYHEPFGHHWQLDGTISIATYFKHEIKYEDDLISYLPNYSNRHFERIYKYKDMYTGDLTAVITNIINSRTSISFAGDYHIQHHRKVTTTVFDALSNTFIDLSQTMWDLDLSGNLEYRLAIPTTLTLSVGYFFSSGELPQGIFIEDDDNYNYAFNASIEHYIF